MMSAVSEAWQIMHRHLGMKFDEIGKVFENWNSEGELVSSINLTSLWISSAYKIVRGTPS